LKINSDFALRSVCGTYVAVALGETAKTFHGIINLNASGAMLFGMLISGTDRAEMTAALTDKYEVSEKRAADSVDRFIASLKAASVL
jgi:hypothetical protein